MATPYKNSHWAVEHKGKLLKVEMVHTGDNLCIMQGMGEDSVNLIYLDPPFNKGRDFYGVPGSTASKAEFTDTWGTDVEGMKPWRGIKASATGRCWRTPTMGGMADFIVEKNLIPDWPDAYPSVHQRLDALDAAGLIHWSSSGHPSLKLYKDASRGRAIDDLLLDCYGLGSTQRTGYPTQKPIALLQIIIRVGSGLV